MSFEKAINIIENELKTCNIDNLRDSESVVGYGWGLRAAISLIEREMNRPVLTTLKSDWYVTDKGNVVHVSQHYDEYKEGTHETRLHCLSNNVYFSTNNFLSKKDRNELISLCGTVTLVRYATLDEVNKELSDD